MCSNCGTEGHYFRECVEPITSLGILAFKRVKGVIRWLLIRRRVSIGYIELMRGKYRIRDVPGIQALVDQTTLEERETLLRQSFESQWTALWSGVPSRRYQVEYDDAKTKMALLMRRGLLRAAIDASTTRWTEPEWGFPKGRRSSRETELDCALRETLEETGVKKECLTVAAEIAPLEERYRGSNGFSYRHRFWIARAPSDLNVGVDETNQLQCREISAVEWCSMEDARAHIRPYSVERLALLEQATVIAETLVTTDLASDSSN